MLFIACSTVRNSTGTNRSQTSDRLCRDSIYLHDSIYVRIRADTVFMEKWHTCWRDRETVRIDTVTQTVKQTETVEVRYIPAFYKYSTAFAILVALWLLMRVVLFIAKRYYSR